MKPFLLLILIFSSFFSQSQNRPGPKLVVGLVIDQMRWDYLYRFNDRYGKDGFKRLLREGASCENSLINYTPSHTGAGHASIYTGSVPAVNGIMGNYWYIRNLKRNYYCCEDSSVNTVGSNSTAGKMSPVNLWGSTMSDELRLSTNMRSKTISIALKDRGSILPGGQMANAAYWFDNSNGGWISSSYYMKDLPEWVNKFNSRNIPDQYLAKGWNTFYPVSTYKQSTADSNRYESKLSGEDRTFPHLTSHISSNKYETFRYLPGSMTYTFEMAKAAMEGEKLGKGEVADFLALSISTTDYVGHSFGPNSIEIEDIYLRLDQDIANFLKYLDQTIGKGQYLFFLSADHGVANNPYFLLDNKVPVGIFDEARIKKEINEVVQKEFGVTGIIETWINYQAYLNHAIIAQNNLDRKKIVNVIMKFLMQQPSVANVADLTDLNASQLQEHIKGKLLNGYNQRFSGDIQYILKPQWFETWRTGSTHGLWNPYDAHIPLIFMGWKVKPGKVYRETYMEDIAPTVCAILNIQRPSGCVGEVIEEVIGK
jgi:predicted AlkP superfamily pyrophosphatase or phosphodiesterase